MDRIAMFLDFRSGEISKAYLRGMLLKFGKIFCYAASCTATLKSFSWFDESHV